MAWRRRTTCKTCGSLAFWSHPISADVAERTGEPPHNGYWLHATTDTAQHNHNVDPVPFIDWQETINPNGGRKIWEAEVGSFLFWIYAPSEDEYNHRLITGIVGRFDRDAREDRKFPKLEQAQRFAERMAAGVK